MIIEFYIYASTLCLYVSVCRVKLSVKDAIQVPTPALHSALPRALNEMIIQMSAARYKSLQTHMTFSLVTAEYLLQVWTMHHSIEMTLNICQLHVLSDNDDSHWSSVHFKPWCLVSSFICHFQIYKCHSVYEGEEETKVGRQEGIKERRNFLSCYAVGQDL